MLYRLKPFYLDAVDLIGIVDGLFIYLNYIIRKGFVYKEYLDGTFIIKNSKHLESMGCQRKVLGNSELTYTMWYYFLFVNIYSLVVD